MRKYERADSTCFTRRYIHLITHIHYQFNYINYLFLIILGLVTKESKIFAKIVLAGDPKQLEAVTKSQVAENYGFSESYLEYLTQLNLYQPTPKYDPRFITFLVKNYRSHASILFVPNRLFYGNRLEACALAGKVFYYLFFHCIFFNCISLSH